MEADVLRSRSTSAALVDGLTRGTASNISETSQAATECWSQSAVRAGACGSILAIAQPGNQVTVLGTPFASTCDGNLWVAVNIAGIRGDMRWDSATT